MTRPSSESSPLARIAKYTEILAKDPSSTVFVPLAELYRRMGMLEDSLDIAMKGVRAQPRFSPGYAILGRIEAQRGDLPGGALSLEKALAIDPDNLLALRSLARIRLQQGQVERALKLLEKAAALEPGNETTRRLLQQARAASAPPQAPAEADPAPADDEENGAPDPLSTVTIAELYIKQGFPRRAMKVYRDLLRVDPRNEEIRRRLLELKERTASAESGPEPKAQRAGESAAAAAPSSVSPPPPPAPEAPAVKVAAPSDPLTVLESWLASIRRRREHV